EVDRWIEKYGATYATRPNAQKADNPKDVTPPMVPASEAINTRKWYERSEDGKSVTPKLTPLIIKPKPKETGQSSIEPNEKTSLSLQETESSTVSLRGHEVPEAISTPPVIAKPEAISKPSFFTKLWKDIKDYFTLDEEDIKSVKVVKAGFDIDPIIKFFKNLFGVEDEKQIKEQNITPGTAIAHADATRSENTYLPVSFDGTTDLRQKGLSYLFDASENLIVNAYEGDKETVRQVLRFLREQAIKKSGLFASAYDVTYGNMQEYKDPGGPNAWVNIARAHAIEKLGDPGGIELYHMCETADILLGFEAVFGDKGIIPLGPGQNAASTEHILDHFTHFDYLGKKITGPDGERYRNAAKRIAVLLSMPIEKGGLYIPGKGFARGIKDINKFINGGRGENVIDYKTATDVPAWGASVVALHREYFPDIDPQEFVDYADKNCKVKIIFDKDKDVIGYDFVDVEMRLNIIKDNLVDFIEQKILRGKLDNRGKIKADILEILNKNKEVDSKHDAVSIEKARAKIIEHLRNEYKDKLTDDLIKEAEDIIQLMIAVEWTNYMVTAHRHCGNLKEADFIKGQIDLLAIPRNGKIGLPYSNMYGQRSEDPNSWTVKNCANTISRSATDTRAMLDIKAGDTFFDPLKIQVKTTVKEIPKLKGKLELKPKTLVKYEPYLGKANIYEYIRQGRQMMFGAGRVFYVAPNGDILAEQKGSLLTVYQRDLYGNEIYRETYQRKGDGSIGARTEVMMPIEAPYLKDKLTETVEKAVEANENEFIGPGRRFTTGPAFAKWLNEFKEGHVYEKEDSKGKKIIFYSPNMEERASITGNKFVIDRPIDRRDIENFDEGAILEGLQQGEKFEEIFANDRNSFAKFARRFNRAGTKSIIELDINHPSSIQSYTGFSYLGRDGKAHELARFQKGDLGLTIDLIEQVKNKKGEVVRTIEDKRIGDIREFVNSSYDTIKTALTEDELKTWIEQLKEKKNLSAHKVLTISDNGKGKIKDKKTFTSIYYGDEKKNIDRHELLRIDKYGLSVIESSGLKHTFGYEDGVIGNYKTKSWADPLTGRTTIQIIDSNFLWQEVRDENDRIILDIDGVWEDNQTKLNTLTRMVYPADDEETFIAEDSYVLSLKDGYRAVEPYLEKIDKGDVLTYGEIKELKEKDLLIKYRHVISENRTELNDKERGIDKLLGKDCEYIIFSKEISAEVLNKELNGKYYNAKDTISNPYEDKVYEYKILNGEERVGIIFSEYGQPLAERSKRPISNPARGFVKSATLGIETVYYDPGGLYQMPIKAITELDANIARDIIRTDRSGNYTLDEKYIIEETQDRVRVITKDEYTLEPIVEDGKQKIVITAMESEGFDITKKLLQESTYFDNEEDKKRPGLVKQWLADRSAWTVGIGGIGLFILITMVIGKITAWLGIAVRKKKKILKEEDRQEYTEEEIERDIRMVRNYDGQGFQPEVIEHVREGILIPQLRAKLGRGESKGYILEEFFKRYRDTWLKPVMGEDLDTSSMDYEDMHLYYLINISAGPFSNTCESFVNYLFYAAKKKLDAGKINIG
ncbi:MAG: hypothetical protein H8D54_03285, partial [Candidatus Omnitrophica bacterium]|nr:hypothetical protein [Candidatus Omnitrophota bacterium]